MSIAEYIESVLDEYHLSLTGLAKKLGYKSKTSLNRIIRGNVRSESILKFEKAMMDAFELSPEEQRRLSEAIQAALYGGESVLTSQAIWDFILSKRESKQNDLRIVDLQTKQDIDLNVRYEDATQIHLNIINCQYVPALFDEAYRLLREGKATVDHYIYVNDNDVRTIRSVSTTMGVFYERGYMGYSRRSKPMDQQQDSGFNECDLLIVCWIDKEGKEHSDLIFFTNSETGTLIESPYMDAERLKLMGLDKDLYSPIKRNYFECSAFEDYIHYSKDYAALEKDHTIWKIKPDVSVDQIPAWILKKAVQEGPEPIDDQFMIVLDRLADVYKDRYKNTYTKHKHAYTVFKRGAMRRFAMSGRMSDHFWMMRPFTPEERLTILMDLLKQQMKNPYVHYYFLKDDSVLRDVEIAYYEGEGMLILDSETDYNLEQGHSEVLITHERMLSLYKDFYMNELLPQYVCAESETCEFLRHLIFEVEALKEEP